MTWEIFVGFTVLVGFIISIVTPVMKLTTIMTELSSSVDGLKDAISQLSIQNEQAHKRIWDRIDEHGSSIDTHDKRITKIEYDMDRFHGSAHSHASSYCREE